jgi:hypothetical protein
MTVYFELWTRHCSGIEQALRPYQDNCVALRRAGVKTNKTIPAPDTHFTKDL